MRIALACGPSSASVRLRCSRTPRSTCAVAAMPYRSTMSTSSPNSTPQPSTNGSVSSSVAPSRVLTGERLHEAGELGEQRGDERAGHELGHATATLGQPVQRSAVEALHERDLGLRDQRTEQPGDEVRAEVADVRVEPAEEVARRGVERLPHRVALARARSGLGQHVGDRRRRARPPRPQRPRWRPSTRRR